jgi:hypothetical protein
LRSLLYGLVKEAEAQGGERWAILAEPKGCDWDRSIKSDELPNPNTDPGLSISWRAGVLHGPAIKTAASAPGA